MSSVLLEFQALVQGQGDLVAETNCIGDARVRYFYLKSLVDHQKSIELLRKRGSLGDRVERDPQKMVDHLLRAGIVAFQNDDSALLVDSVPHEIARSISAPTTENVILSAPVAFTEKLESNVALLRHLLVSRRLLCRTTTLGEAFPRQVAFLYLDEMAQPELVEAAWNDLTDDKRSNLFTRQDLVKRLSFKSWCLVPQLHSTELPSETVGVLLQGRVVIFLDQHPFALVAPGCFFDAFETMEDNNNPAPIAWFFRFLRGLGMLVALVAPALYVALVAVNPETLRIQLALSIAQSREGVPYPAIIEIALMMIFLELIWEASIRLPKSIGPTITMVGGIILGQAVVQAQLVSNLLIIVLSAMAIANFSLVGIQNMNSIRICKYIILAFASVFGLLGLALGIAWFCVYLAGVKLFGVPYLKRWTSRGEA